jgi:ketosteroid isomerase-like protein
MFVECTGVAKNTGKSFSSPEAWAAEFDAQGKISHLSCFGDSLALARATSA